MILWMPVFRMEFMHWTVLGMDLLWRKDLMVRGNSFFQLSLKYA